MKVESLYLIRLIAQRLLILGDFVRLDFYQYNRQGTWEPISSVNMVILLSLQPNCFMLFLRKKTEFLLSQTSKYTHKHITFW